MATFVVGTDDPEGAIFGRATTTKIGFYGLSTGVAQQSVSAIGTTTISQVGTSGVWAFSSSTAAQAFVARVISIQDALAALNLVVES